FSPDSNRISVSRITMDPNTGFERHVHPHNHVLIIIQGGGLLVYDRGDGIEERLDFREGDVFNVPGMWPHAVTAGPVGITMFSIGSPPMHLIDPDRMVFVEAEHRWMIPQKIVQD